MTDTDDVQWAEPPEYAYFAGGSGGGRYKWFAATLKSRPGAWAVLPGEKKTESSAKATALNIWNGKVAGFAPKHSFEAAVTGTSIYVRWVGNGQESTGTTSQPQPQPEEPAPAPSGGPAEPGAVREWAVANGYEVSERGRLPGHILEAHSAARRRELLGDLA